jgi:pimeloyl-ACP methyl ester carboxylesterase
LGALALLDCDLHGGWRGIAVRAVGDPVCRERFPPGIINPNLERMYAKRAHAQTVKFDGASHSVYESHPKEVAALIEQAAQQQGQ